MAREYAGIITRESDRLSHLIDNVLDFARLERGKASYSVAECRLDEVVERALDVCRYRLDKEKMRLRTEIEERLPPVRMDEDAMALVLINLVDNAVKYAGEGGEVGVRLARSPGGLALSVRDRGPGISADEQQRIFERFYRATNARMRNVRGSGIGLSLVKHIAEAHGGRVEVESALGQGATFTVFVPAAPRDAGPRRRRRRRAPRRRPVAAAGRRILVVEDEPDLVRGLRDALEFEGFDVVSSGQGREGVKLARERTPDLVLLDLMLPDMNGFAVCEEIRAVSPLVPIIMLTARSQEADKIRGLEVGADDYVTKPFTVGELVARINAIFRRLQRGGAGAGSSDEIHVGAAVIYPTQWLVRKGKTYTLALRVELIRLLPARCRAAREILRRSGARPATPPPCVDNSSSSCARRSRRTRRSPTHRTIYGTGCCCFSAALALTRGGGGGVRHVTRSPGTWRFCGRRGGAEGRR
jgi:DNA-binding response OmpR family regulator/two-component sensor histidine kinase